MSADQSWTIRRLLEWTTDHFQSKGIESARTEAQLLLAQALGCSRITLYTRFEEQPAEPVRTRFRELVQARLRGSPVAHLLRRKEFFSLEFEVSPDVLVPRDDTGYLVSECLTAIKSLPTPRVLDIGTGSGCIAVTLATQHKTVQVTATDLSPQALTIARRNAEKHKVADRIRFLEGDLFAPLSPDAQFEAIVSNPPYIRSDDITTLAPEVRDHDPRLALDGGPDGFAVIDRLLASAPVYLAPNGLLMLEVGFDQQQLMNGRLTETGWEVVRWTADAAGHPRVVTARRL